MIGMPADDAATAPGSATATPSLSLYREIDRAEWARLAADMAQPLSETEIVQIRGLGDMLDLIDGLNESRGTTVVMVLHDLGLACRYADHIVAMKDGAIVARGVPTDVITSDLVRTVFGLDACVLPDPVTGTPLVVPATGRRATRSEPRPHLSGAPA